MLWINPMKIYTCILLAFVAQVVFTQAMCISKTAKEFENICYELFTTKMNWAQAQKYCSNFNGLRSLAKVYSPFVLDFLNSLRPPNTVLSEGGRVWLGASDQLQEGEWLWTDGTKANLTSMWGKNEPNNLGGKEHCLQLYLTHLNDDECHERYSFICMEVHDPNTISKTDPTTSLTSMTTAAPISFTTEGNVFKPGNISKNTLDPTTTSKTEPTTSVTSMSTTAILSFTTEGNVSKTGNISKDHSNRIKDKMYSFGLAEWIGIGIGVCVVVTLSVLAVVLVIKLRCKTVTQWESGSRQPEPKQ
ncbi:uncharacterized protein LOC131955580 [Physella acuta]|uniref:uncharacterized protein LOC131955580 n=1 Tax=Physella acuta TaxID=109671 RepID=UPI0027DC4FCA|nr:uncharacterized protein LOC131955580 [Physella acuta]